MSRYRTNDGEYQPKPRDLGTSGLSLFQAETGVTAPTPTPATGEQRRDRVLDALEAKRRDWIDRIHAALVRQLAANGYDGIVSANEARRVFATFADYDPTADLRFLPSVFRRAGWVYVDYDGVNDAPGTHGRRIMRYRYDPTAAERSASTEAA